MGTRFLLILAGLSVAGLVGAFLFYVSVLSIVTAFAILMGIVGTLILGYWAGSCSPDSPDDAPGALEQRHNISAINASRNGSPGERDAGNMNPTSESWVAPGNHPRPSIGR